MCKEGDRQSEGVSEWERLETLFYYISSAVKEEARWTLHISLLRQKTHLNGKHIVFIILQELKEQGCHGNSHLSECRRAAEGLVLGPEEWREREKRGGGGGREETRSQERERGFGGKRGEGTEMKRVEMER